jgi:subtilisin family serine protease
LPPAGERRFVPDEVIALLRDNLTEVQIDRLLRANRLARTVNGGERIALVNARVFRFRITDGRAVATVITAMARDPGIVSLQPNYVFAVGQSQRAESAAGDANVAEKSPASPVSQYAPSSAAPQQESEAAASFGPLQYAVRKLRLDQAHQMTRGDQVLVAVIDSRIDASHPEFGDSIVKQIDVVDDKDAQPHAHGTAMAGAIVARSRLTGVAPAARVIAVRAFGTTAFGITTGTSYDLARALDRAAAEGARVFNLSFAGPNDPLLARAILALHDQGAILIAAAGNAGPKSAPLFPAADPNVIAVTATDTNDTVFAGANRGPHIAVAAPGVDILVPGPRGAYEMTTGTSVAAAHVSGLAALLLSRKSGLNSKAVRKLLTQSARDLGVPGSDSDYGAGLADAQKALGAMGPSEADAEVSGAAVR